MKKWIEWQGEPEGNIDPSKRGLFSWRNARREKDRKKKSVGQQRQGLYYTSSSHNKKKKPM